MEAIRKLSAHACTVLRDGSVTSDVLAENLTIGDIVFVKSGEKVPADVRVLGCTDLKVNNSTLTGENIDVKLSVEPRHE